MTTARHLFSQIFQETGLPVVLVYPRSKRPIPDPVSGTWWRITSWHEFEGALSNLGNGVNLALECLGLVQVDCDSYDALKWAKSRGLASTDSNWILKTGRGWRAFYNAPAPGLFTHTDPTHETPDLLAAGHLALVPPSTHPSGFLYRWATGHSPADIPFTELSSLPIPILEAWRELKESGSSRMRRSSMSAPPGWLALIYEAIYDHLEGIGHRLLPGRHGGITTTCPLHEDRSPSFSIHPSKGWKCFSGCGEGRLTLLAHRLGINVLKGQQE